MIFGLDFEVSDILEKRGELTTSRLSKDTNKCLKEDLYLPNERWKNEFIENIFTTTKTYDSVTSLPRLQASLELARAALAVTNEGDFVETGMYTGGSAGTLLYILLSYDKCNRKFYGFDSFEGLPPNHDEDKSKYGLVLKPGIFTISVEKVINNFKKWGVYNQDRVVITKGWFNETLPKAPITKISFLRADGDLFVSTMDALEHLYHKIVPGGLIYIDDYGSFAGCREAVNEFRTRHHIYAPMHYVRESNSKVNILFEAVWWQKQKKRPSKKVSDKI